MASSSDEALLSRLQETMSLDDARQLARADVTALAGWLKEAGFKMGPRARLQELLLAEKADVNLRQTWTVEELESLRTDCFASDVPHDLPGLEACSREQLVEYFESGGELLPDGVERSHKMGAAPPPPAPRPPSPPRQPEPTAEEPAAAPPQPSTPRRGPVEGVLCLHGEGSCGDIMRKQLRPLGLEAALGVELRSLDGRLPVEPRLHKGARMLKVRAHRRRPAHERHPATSALATRMVTRDRRPSTRASTTCSTWSSSRSTSGAARRVRGR